MRYLRYLAESLVILLISSGVVGYLVLGQQTAATQSSGLTAGVSSPTLQSSPIYTTPLGIPTIDHVSINEVADGTTTYNLSAQAVDQSEQGKPIHASDITCKLWLVQQIPDRKVFQIPTQTLQNVNALQSSITGTVQGQPYDEVSGLTFDAITPQTHFCNSNGQGIWNYQIAATVNAGTYDLIVLTDWNGIHWNWSWAPIVIKK